MIQFWNPKDKATVNNLLDQYIPLVDTYIEFIVLYLAIPIAITYILMNYGVQRLLDEIVLAVFGALVTVFLISKLKKALSGIGIGGTPETRGKNLKSNW